MSPLVSLGRRAELHCGLLTLMKIDPFNVGCKMSIYACPCLQFTIPFTYLIRIPATQLYLTQRTRKYSAGTLTFIFVCFSPFSSTHWGGKPSGSSQVLTGFYSCSPGDNLSLRVVVAHRASAVPNRAQITCSP